jgi:hypothetical protein
VPSRDETEDERGSEGSQDVDMVVGNGASSTGTTSASGTVTIGRTRSGTARRASTANMNALDRRGSVGAGGPAARHNHNHNHNHGDMGMGMGMGLTNMNMNMHTMGSVDGSIVSLGENGLGLEGIPVGVGGNMNGFGVGGMGDEFDTGMCRVTD